jgi:hypothetical protein
MSTTRLHSAALTAAALVLALVSRQAPCPAHCIVTWVTCVRLLHQCLAHGDGHAERCCGREA